MRALAAILVAHWRSSVHWILSVRGESRLKVGFVSVSALLLEVALLEGSRFGLRLFEDLGAGVLTGPGLDLRELVMARLLATFSLALLTLLVVSNILVAFATFYRSREVPFLLLRPIPFPVFFLGRFSQTVAFSSWASAFLGGPVVLAWGLETGAPPLFYLALFPFWLPFVALPAAVGTSIAHLGVRLLAGRRPRWGLLLGGAGAAAIGLLSRLRLRAPDLSDVDTFQAVIENLGRSQSPWLPSQWLTRGLLSAGRGDPGEAAFQLFLLTANAVFFVWVATLIAERTFPIAWSNLQGGGRSSRRRGRGPIDMVERALGFLPPADRALVTKDLRAFWRDPTQWSQFLVFFGLMGLYLANLPDPAKLPGTWRDWATLLNVAASLLILASLTTRFVYPAVSLEGPRFWMLGLAPISLRRIVWIKLGLACGTTGLFTIALGVLSAVRLQMPASLAALTLASLAAATVGLCGLAVGLGSLFPDFDEDNPSRIVSGMGGTLCFLLSMVYVLVVTLALALVVFGDPIRSSGVDLDPGAALAAALFVVAASTAGATVVPMSMGQRSLANREG